MNNQTFSPSTDPEEHPKKSYKFLFIAAALLFVLSLVLIFSDGKKDSSKNPPGEGTPSGASLDSLLFAQLPGALAERGLDGLKLDDITFNEVKDQAVLWMAASDADTGELLAREPEAILALWNEESGQWSLYQKDDDVFLDKLLESDFRDSEIYARFTEYDPKASITGTIYGGFKLPWRGGLTKRLTWSVGHTSCANAYCLYAFDFADGTMFEITAAKSGYVYHFKDSCNNGVSTCTNSITIQDRSTTPYTYHIYLHIAKGSVPENLLSGSDHCLSGRHRLQHRPPPALYGRGTGYLERLHQLLLGQIRGYHLPGCGYQLGRGYPGRAAKAGFGSFMVRRNRTHLLHQR